MMDPWTLKKDRPRPIRPCRRPGAASHCSRWIREGNLFSIVPRVRFGVTLPPFNDWSDPRTIMAMARESEAAGWDGFFLWDHVTWNPAWGGSPPIADPWICLAAAATATSRVLLGPMVTPLARRRPQTVARQLVTLDHLCGGRAVLGVGLGAREDYEFFGANLSTTEGHGSTRRSPCSLACSAVSPSTSRAHTCVCTARRRYHGLSMTTFRSGWVVGGPTAFPSDGRHGMTVSFRARSVRTPELVRTFRPDSRARHGRVSRFGPGGGPRTGQPGQASNSDVLGDSQEPLQQH